MLDGSEIGEPMVLHTSENGRVSFTFEDNKIDIELHIPGHLEIYHYCENVAFGLPDGIKEAGGHKLTVPKRSRMNLCITSKESARLFCQNCGFQKQFRRYPEINFKNIVNALQLRKEYDEASSMLGRYGY